MWELLENQRQNWELNNMGLHNLNRMDTKEPHNILRLKIDIFCCNIHVM